MRLILFTLLFLPVLLLAQEDFFSDDFAKDPLSTQTKELKKDKKVTEDNSSQDIFKKKTNSLFKDLDEPAQDKQPAVAFKKLEKIISAGLILNALDEDHASRNLETLFKILNDHSIEGGAVYFLGSYDNKLLTSQTTEALELLGTEIKVTLQKPEQYKVTNSPTWILETKEGEILMEGIENIGRYINSNGEFIPPQ